MRYFTIFALACFPFVGAFVTFSATTSFDFFASVILLAIALSTFFESRPIQIFKPLILLIFPLIIAAAHFFLGANGYNGDQLILRYLCLGGFILYASQTKNGVSLGDLRLSFRISISILLGLAVIGLFHEFRFGFARIGGTARIDLTFGNPNYLAAYLLTTLPLFAAGLYDAIKQRHIARQWMEAFYLLGIFFLILLSGSRGVIFLSALLLGITFLSFILCAKKGLIVLNRGLIISISVATVLIAGVWTICYGDQVIEKTASLLDGGGQSEAGRLMSYKIAWTAVTQDTAALFFGSGPGAFYSWVMEFPDMNLPLGFQANQYKHVHSEYLEILVEVGLLGSAFLLGFILLTAKDLFNTIAGRKESEWHEALALSAALAAVATFGALSVATRQMVYCCHLPP